MDYLIPWGEPLSGDPEEREQQVQNIERTTQEYYQSIIDDHGPAWGKAAMYVDEGLGFLGDVFVDPVPLTADLPVGVVNAMRKYAPASSTSRILGGIARRTGRVEDVVDYLNKSKKAMEDAKKAYDAKPSTRAHRKFLQMQSQYEQAKAMAAAAAKDHPVERIVHAAASEADMEKIAKGDVKLETVPIRDETYADFIDTQLMQETVEGATGPVSAAKRKAGVLSAIRRNIDVAARRNAPEDLLRDWERTYSFILDADPEDVPAVVSRFSGQDAPADFDHLTRSLLIDGEGNTIFHIGDWDEVSEASRIAYGPDDVEWHAQGVRDILSGRDVDGVMMPDTPVVKFQTAQTMKPRGLGPDDTIDVEAINRTYRAHAKKMEKVRQDRIKELKDRTAGYAIDNRGNVVGTGKKTRRGKPRPGPYDRRQENVGIDPKLDRRKKFDPEGLRRSRADDIKHDLEELQELQEAGKVEAQRMDWDAAGGNPLKTNIEPAAWNRNIREVAGDLFARGIYPESWNVTTPGLLSAILFPFREPARGLQSVYPKMWSRTYRAMRAKDAEYQRAIGAFKGVLEESGAYKANKDGTLRMVNRELNDQMYDALNVQRDTPAYNAIMEKLPEDARNAVRRFRQTMDYYAKKQGIYDSDMYIEGYISWMLDPHNNPGFVNEIKNNPTLRVRARHLLERGGTGDPEYIKDLGTITDVYASGMARKMHYEPLFLDLDSMRRHFIHLNKDHELYLNGEVGRIINLLNGKPSRGNQFIASWGMGVTDALRRVGHQIGNDWLQNVTYNPDGPGRAIMAMTSSAYAGKLAGTMHYFHMALGTSFPTTAGGSGLASTIEGLASITTPAGQRFAKQAGVFGQFRKIMEEGPLSKVTDGLADFQLVAPSINRTEGYVRGMGMFTGMHRLSRKMGFKNFAEAAQAGHGDAIVANAVRYTEEVNHMFGVLGKPTMFSRLSRSLGVAATQFLSFVPKQMELLLDMGRKNPGYFLRYMQLSGWIQRVAATELGVDMSSYVGMGFMPKDITRMRSMGVELLTAMGSFGAEFTNMIAGNGNPSRFYESYIKLMESGGEFLPFMRMIDQHIQAGKAMYTALFETGDKEEYTLAWEMSRKYDRHGDFVRQYNFEWPHPDEAFSSMKSDFFASMLGMKSISDDLDQQRRENKVKLIQERLLASRDAAIAAQEAARTGDMDKLNESITRLTELGFKMDYADLVKARYQAQLIEEKIRMLMSLPTESKVEFLETMGEIRDDE
jgi:hypothetical protein